MRVTLADASLARYAGQFVWLSLNFDNPVNAAAFAHYGVNYTPMLFVIDPKTERAMAKQVGGLTLPELTTFLDRRSSGDELLWSSDPQRCAENAAAQAPRMPRDAAFARVVLAGLTCVNRGGSPAAFKTLEPLAEEAIALPSILRDHRFQLYQQLMVYADRRGDRATVKKWGDRWLAEIEATKPANDDEHTALDVARVDAADLLEAPKRVIPALIESERAMPHNYNASLRLAQMELGAKHYDKAIAACDRGLARAPGSLGKSWLLTTKANALSAKGDRAAAHRVLEQALVAAKKIAAKQARDSNVARITKMLD